jgi:hypothetical protein
MGRSAYDPPPKPLLLLSYNSFLLLFKWRKQAQDALANIFDSNSEFWWRAPWMRQDDVKRACEAVAVEDAKGAEADESGTLERLGSVGGFAAAVVPTPPNSLLYSSI